MLVHFGCQGWLPEGKDVNDEDENVQLAIPRCRGDLDGCDVDLDGDVEGMPKRD